MPLYFFDSDNGTNLVRDDRGLELANDQVACDEGTRALGEMAKDYLAESASPQKDISMWVRNEQGEAVLQLSIAFAVKKLQ